MKKLLLVICLITTFVAKSGETKHVVVDFVWQMIEQGIGGLVVAYVFSIAYRIEAALE